MNFARRFDGFLLWLIGVYQRHLSPRKGWRCAHSRLHGGPGCSGFARQAIQSHGHRAALGLVRARFRECKSASQTLRAGRAGAFDAPPHFEEPPREKRKTANPAGDCVPDPDCCFCAQGAVDCGPGILSACDASALGSCDASACHCGACDVLGCFACS